EAQVRGAEDKARLRWRGKRSECAPVREVGVVDLGELANSRVGAEPVLRKEHAFENRLGADVAATELLERAGEPGVEVRGAEARGWPGIERRGQMGGEDGTTRDARDRVDAVEQPEFVESAQRAKMEQGGAVAAAREAKRDLMRMPRSLELAGPRTRVSAEL